MWSGISSDRAVHPGRGVVLAAVEGVERHPLSAQRAGLLFGGRQGGLVIVERLGMRASELEKIRDGLTLLLAASSG